MPGRDRVRTLVESRRFQRFITAVILVNAATLGCETSPFLLSEYGGLLHAIDRLALGVFVVELVLRLHAYRRGFFSDAWSWFDLIIVGMALLPSGGGLSVLRALRILRALRLISVVPSMTADGWPEITRRVMAERPCAWVFFVAYILVSPRHTPQGCKSACSHERAFAFLVASFVTYVPLPWTLTMSPRSRRTAIARRTVR
ncbi:ion transporter [Actinocorallia sp. B10E7]|uniref:ion transporter n=1 Tax=Actinocorallia sp. B10E7 TaxID=3153558 RepID=UPI00325F5181